MGLFIGICFILSSVLALKFTQNNATLAQYNKVLFLNIFSLNIIYYIFMQDFSVANLYFTAASLAFYLVSIYKTKFNLLIEVAVLAGALAAAFVLGFSLLNIALIGLAIAILYVGLKQYEGNIIFIFLSLLPVTVYTLFTNPDNLFYILAIMSILGSVRFFLENKILNSTALLNNLVVITFAYYLLTLNQTIFIAEYSALMIAFTYLVFACIVQTVLNRKNTLVVRILSVSDYQFPVYAKIFVFNIFATLIAYAHTAYQLNIYICIALTAVPLILGYLKLWYIENEYTFNK